MVEKRQVDDEKCRGIKIQRKQKIRRPYKEDRKK